MYEALPIATSSPVPIEQVLNDGTTLFTWVMSSLGTVITTILSNPILLLGFLIALCGLVIGITRRIMNLS